MVSTTSMEVQDMRLNERGQSATTEAYVMMADAGDNERVNKSHVLKEGTIQCPYAYNGKRCTFNSSGDKVDIHSRVHKDNTIPDKLNYSPCFDGSIVDAENETNQLPYLISKESNKRAILLNKEASLM